MDGKKNVMSYEDFRETASDYGEDKGHDFLTDPAAVAKASEKAEHEKAVNHGDMLRATREKRGFSLDELARRTGIARDALAQLEAGEFVLPLGQLIKLSKALSLRMADVISTGEESFTIVKSDQRQSFLDSEKPGSQLRITNMNPWLPERKIGRWSHSLLRYIPPESTSLLPRRTGVHLRPGWRNGSRHRGHQDVLKPGDSVYYDSTSMHLVKAHGGKPAKILAVLIS
jgi:transcriptional regulator with XRE-family HTH domain